MLHVARSPNEIEAELTGWSNKPLALRTLVDLYRQDRNLFFDVAVIGVPPGAGVWQKEMAAMASAIGSLARNGYKVTSDDSNQLGFVGADAAVTVDGEAKQDAIAFIEDIRGTFDASNHRKDFVGCEVTEAEMLFKLGSPAERGAAAARISEFINARPTVLKLDQQDCDAIQHGMPAYAVYDLMGCATRALAAPTAVFEGTRANGDLSFGRAYCGKPKKAHTNSGALVPPPNGMVYCVYADQEGYVYDWDWVREDPHHAGRPVGFAQRFSKLVEAPAEVNLSVPPIVPAPFEELRAWHSFRGDCMFFYASDAPAYASRVNNDLTEYRSLDSDQLVGCKIKNFDEILAKVAREAGGSSVTVGAILAGSLVRQLADHQRKEKQYFLRVLASIQERNRNEFFEAALQLKSDSPDYLRTICDLAIRYSAGLPIPEMEEAVDARQQTEEMYLQLITFAGKSEVSMSRGSYAQV